MTVREADRGREDDRYRSELQEGNLALSPSPAPDHMIVMRQLLIQLDEQLPSGLQRHLEPIGGFRLAPGVMWNLLAVSQRPASL